MKVMLVFGTRPEAIKMAPVVKKPQSMSEYFQTIVCVTAQHRQMLDQVLHIFDIAPDYDLDIMQRWDRSPRVANEGGGYVGATPEKFEKHIRQALDLIQHKHPSNQILFLKSWNEWGEGNYVEPDERYGHGWLEAISRALHTAP